MEGIRKKNANIKEKSVSKIFAGYIFLFCITAVLILALEGILFLKAVNKGTILSANYYEQKIETNRDEIEKAQSVEEFIPKECSYAVYDKEGNITDSNVSKIEADKMWDIIQNGAVSNGSSYFKVIQRESGICIVKYRLIATFSNPVLNYYMPNAELIFNSVMIGLFIIEIIIFSKAFKNKLKREIKILKDAAEKIEMENLDFEVKYCGISEVNEVIKTLDKMKEELNKSLKKQWDMEEGRKEQMAALAHDLKTPLTIIKGSSELLEELDLKKDAAELNENIISEVANMEFYISKLIEIIKSEKEYELVKKKINLVEFIKEVIKTGNSLCSKKKIKFKSEIENIPEVIKADRSALKRALVNVISNAVDYSVENGEVSFKTYADNDRIAFIIEDCGKGFSREELKLATERFYQGDKSRNSKNHYGMGLYISKKLIEKHDGNIYLDNSEKLGGAKVTLELFIK